MSLTLPILGTSAALLAAFWPALSLLVFPATYPQVPALYAAPGGTYLDARQHCQRLQGSLRFCEDLHPHGNDMIASCDYGRGKWNTVMGTWIDSTSSGNLVSISNDTVRDIKIDGLEGEFHPLGIAVHDDQLWVVNHQHHASTLSEFRLHGTTASFRRHLTVPAITTPNAVTRLKDGLLLVTNDHGISRRSSQLGQTLETFLRLPLGSIVLVDTINNRARRLTRVAFANGIVYSAREGLIAVASTSRRSCATLCGPVQIFAIYGFSYDDCELRFQREVKLDFHTDNLSLLDPGRVLVAGHPDGLGLMKVVEQPYATGEERRIVGSQVALVDMKTGDARDIYKEDGTTFRTSSSAIGDAEGNLYISGLYETGVLHCTGVRF